MCCCCCCCRVSVLITSLQLLDGSYISYLTSCQHDNMLCGEKSKFIVLMGGQGALEAIQEVDVMIVCLWRKDYNLLLLRILENLGIAEQHSISDC